MRHSTTSRRFNKGTRFAPLLVVFGLILSSGAGASGSGTPPWDWDGDGIPNSSDACPYDPEDFDGVADEDGCPESDSDSDGDGIPDEDDGCPGSAEDFDQIQDEDGCPESDSDSDGDGIADEDDGCPEEAEDPDGVEDDDGCPEDDDPPSDLSSWAGTWITDCAEACGTMILTQNGTSVSGTYAGRFAGDEGTVEGTVSANRLSGTWRRYGNSGPFTFVMASSGLEFQGNYKGSYYWNGRRVGATPPQVVVVVPGIEGSVLRQPSDNTRMWIRLAPRFLDDLDLSTSPTFNVEDIVREIDLGPDGGLIRGGDVYKPLIVALQAKGFVEYKHANGQYARDGRPKRITPADCDQAQKTATLFVFPYDWRKDNAEAATFLKEYVEGCIQKIHPGARVDIVAHSMGGLIARRMILNTETQARIHPLVSKLITAGSPFWGAPKANYMLETGDFFDYPRLNAFLGNVSLVKRTMKDTVKSFPALHQILPSKALFDNAPVDRKPFGEGGPGLLGLGEWRYWDINQSRRRDENYDYDMYKTMMNTNRPFSPFKPMDVNETFHGHQNPFGSKQDDWSNDTTGVGYYHLVGVDVNTPVKLRAMHLTAAKKLLDGTRWQVNIEAGNYVLPEWVSGDGTVPRFSAERTARTNAQGAVLQVFNGLNHLQLVTKPAALECILKFLGVGSICQQSEPLYQASAVPASRHIALVNVQGVKALDASGEPIDTGADASVVPAYGDASATLAIPSDGEVFIRFQTLSPPDGPLLARVMTTDGEENYVRKVIYVDAQIRHDRYPQPSEDMLGLLHIDEAGNTRLQFDFNRDSAIDSLDEAVGPTVDSTNPRVVTDELGPTIRIAGIRPVGSTRYVTLDAYDDSGILADTGVGTPPFLVSLHNDGIVIDNLVRYTFGSEVEVPAGYNELTACAVDGAGNRLCELFSIPEEGFLDAPPAQSTATGTAGSR